MLPALLVLTAATSAEISSSTIAPKLADFPELLDRDWLSSLATRAATGSDAAASEAAVPPMPTDFTSTLLLISREGNNNTTLLGDAFVSGSTGVVRMSGLYHVETPGGEDTVGANLILSSVTNTNTVIINDPTTGDPTCRIQRTNSVAAAIAAPPGLPLGFAYLGAVLVRGSLSRQPGKTSILFVDAFSSSPVAIVEIYDGSDDMQIGLYGNVEARAIAPHLVASPVGMECQLSPSAAAKTHAKTGSVEAAAVSEGVEGILAQMLKSV
jgi:hypothetical protein